MPSKTAIEWTGTTWNPATGCTPISEGCRNCYARPLAERLKRMSNPRYINGFEPTMHRDKIGEPCRWGTPQRVFVNSMSDLLHSAFPDEFVLDVFRTMAVRAPQHEYHVLTKRAERWPEIGRLVVERFGRWPSNVFPGVTVESARHLDRADLLGQVGDEYTTRMISFEPALDNLGGSAAIEASLRRNRIGWAITGGESGWSARPAQIEWFEGVRDAAVAAGVPYFHKQHGGRGTDEVKKRGGELATLDGQLWKQTPEIMRRLF